MKRDMELVRKILFAMEEHPEGFAPSKFDLPDFTQEQIGYHAYLMNEAGLIEAADVTCMGSTSPEAIPTKLTWEGHEFIDAARSDTIWNSAMSQIKAIGGGVTIAMLTALLKKLMAEKLGLAGI
ncbi:MAG: DUF2513 domain-containing protein [Planctomycetia bacterium]|nr:DUF2513 domain-containing protein [Planctomycetia bacterium]